MSQFSLDANGGRGGVNFRTAAEAALAYARFLVRIFSKKKKVLYGVVLQNKKICYGT